MELMKFRVENFRSVEDSGWINVDRTAAFIGVNESGKTNLLTPLWKLNPAREGEIQPTADYPRKILAQSELIPLIFSLFLPLFRQERLRIASQR